jgi:hypothetical protein
MPDALVRYADIEQLLLDWAQALFPTAALDMELPYNLTLNTDLIVLARIGGPMDAVPSIERPTVDLDVFAVGRDRARHIAMDAALAVRHRLINVPLSDTTTVVSDVRSIAGVARRPWDDNTDLWRYGATFGLTVKSRIHLT